jgi:hypothetical protein
MVCRGRQLLSTGRVGVELLFVLRDRFNHLPIEGVVIDGDIPYLIIPGRIESKIPRLKLTLKTLTPRRIMPYKWGHLEYIY